MLDDKLYQAFDFYEIFEKKYQPKKREAKGLGNKPPPFLFHFRIRKQLLVSFFHLLSAFYYSHTAGYRMKILIVSITLQIFTIRRVILNNG